MRRERSWRADRRILLRGCIAVVLILGLGRGFPRLLRWTADARARDAEMRIERERALADLRLLPRVRDSVRARRQAVERELHTLLPGATTGALSAGFAELIDGHADETGIHVGAIDVRADTQNASSFARVTARAEVSGDLKGIARFIAALEGGDRRVAVRDLSIASTTSGPSAANINELRATVVLEGLGLRPSRGHLTASAR